MILNITSLEQVKHCNALNWDLETVHRFWSKINIPDNLDDCWEWQAGKMTQGYGSFWINQKMYRSHRIMYECYYGNIPFNFLIRHTCDNPPCVNPRHLLIGTQKNNIIDAVERNRTAFGERNINSILTEQQVKQILNYYIQNNYTQKQLAKLFKVKISTINCIISTPFFSNR